MITLTAYELRRIRLALHESFQKDNNHPDFKIWWKLAAPAFAPADDDTQFTLTPPPTHNWSA